MLIGYSSASEAERLNVPRTLRCRGYNRNFPGFVLCQDVNKKACWGSSAIFGQIGCLGGGPDSAMVEEGTSAGAFTTWETTKKTRVWKRFEKHMRLYHMLPSRYFPCYRCKMQFNDFERFFDHSYRLLDSGVFCRPCRYPFRLGDPLSTHFYEYHKNDPADFPNGIAIVRFPEFISKFMENKSRASMIAVPNIGENRKDPHDSGRLDTIHVAGGSFGESIDVPPNGTNSVISSEQNGYSIDPETGRYWCRQCEKSFFGASSMKKHLVAAHVERKCPECGQTYTYNKIKSHNRSTCIKSIDFTSVKRPKRMSTCDVSNKSTKIANSLKPNNEIGLNADAMTLNSRFNDKNVAPSFVVDETSNSSLVVRNAAAEPILFDAGKVKIEPMTSVLDYTMSSDVDSAAVSNSLKFECGDSAGSRITKIVDGAAALVSENFPSCSEGIAVKLEQHPPCSHDGATDVKSELFDNTSIKDETSTDSGSCGSEMTAVHSAVDVDAPNCHDAGEPIIKTELDGCGYLPCSDSHLSMIPRPALRGEKLIPFFEEPNDMKQES